MRHLLVLAVAFGIAAPAVAQEAPSPDSFQFVVLGDMPYDLPDDYARFERLIGAVNTLDPAFTLHIGDFKSGSTPCSDENFQKIKDEFALFRGPLVYTPGDNEWTDCHREKAGEFDPLERLAKVRSMFFADARSQGGAPLTVERQADLAPEYKTYVENARFETNGVLVATVHVVGSNNNFEVRDQKAADEFFARDAANAAWIESTFAKAETDDAAAIVLAMQANMFEQRNAEGGLDRQSGFLNTVEAIAKGAEAFGKPVLVTHGDSHVLEITRLPGADGKPLKNVFRLQVPGEEMVEAVRVTVDPQDPAVFGFQLIVVPENGTM